jgi:hypothetical protein
LYQQENLEGRPISIIVQKQTKFQIDSFLLADIVREILENRAEIYKALNRTPRSPPSEEEEGPTQEDIILADHLKLQQEILKKGDDGPPKEN